MHPAARHCKCCPDDTPCNCGCPCGTTGGIVSCDGRIAWPPEATITLTTTPIEVEFYTKPAGGGGRLYHNQSDIDDYIAETDPNAAGDGYNGINIKCRSKFDLTGSTYTITDNTSVGCSITHFGIRVARTALNGDTYLFDAMGGLPRVRHTFTVLSTHRRSGNDVSGVEPGTGDSYVNTFFKDFEVIDEDELGGDWWSMASIDSSGAALFAANFGPSGRGLPKVPTMPVGKFVRCRWKSRFTNTTVDTGSEGRFNYSLYNPLLIPQGSTGLDNAFESQSSWLGFLFGWAVDGIGSSPASFVPVCSGSISLSYSDPNQPSYSFNVSDRATADGSYTSYSPSSPLNPLLMHEPFFTSATYKSAMPDSPYANLITAINSVASVGSRSNPGGQSCARCYNIDFTQTDGDTSAVTTIFSGEVVQVVDSRLNPGEDPRTRPQWTHQTTWQSIDGVTPSMSLVRMGNELWIARVGSTHYALKGGDCPDSIAYALANVSEEAVFSTTGSGTASSPTFLEQTSRLKIDTRTFTATALDACTFCLDDPCEEPCGPWNTGEGVIDGRDQHWEIETGEGTGVFTPAWSYPPYPLHATPGPDATWIGLEDGNAFPSAEIRLFRTEIEITGTPADITGVLNSDTSVVSINVNGTMVDGPIATNPYSFTLPAAELIAGTNVILFEVEGDGIVTDGLLVEWD